MNTPTQPSSKRLRVEPGDGSPITEYSIESGTVSVRTVDLNRSNQDSDQNEWQQLTPDQLRFHVEHHTVLAEWLKRQMGWRRLLRECARNSEEGEKAA